MAESTLKEEFAAVVGEKETLAYPEVEAYSVDGRQPSLAVFPRDEHETSKILEIADRGGDTIVPWGGGTKIALGNAPTRIDCVVSTSHLNRVLEYEPEDLTVTAQSGMSLGDLQHKLAARDQFLPLDAPLPSKATLGGIGATNSSGPGRLAYGSLRDMLIGIKVAHPGGKVSKAGGKVVKNVAGYDMSKLYIGSLGTLGITLEMTFKVRPLPEERRTIVTKFPSASEVFEASNKILNSKLQPTAVEFIDPRTMTSLKENSGGPDRTHVLAVSVEGSTADVNRHEHEVSDIMNRAGRRESEALGRKEHDDFWERLANLTELVAARVPGLTLCKTSVLSSKAGEMVKLIEKSASRRDLQHQNYAHAINGIIYTYFLTPTLGLEEIRNVSSCITELRDGAVSYDGSLVLERAPLKVKEKVGVWGHIGGELALMKAIREKFDPKGILNPGRFAVGV